LDELRRRLTASGTIFALARVKHELESDLARAGFIDRLGPGRVFPTLPTAATAYADWCRVRYPTLLSALDVTPGGPAA
ncbi:MAG: sodium-independent anion transporter, partial [Actinomycetes bacterium]